jgi:hypothetical protein
MPRTNAYNIVAANKSAEQVLRPSSWESGTNLKSKAKTLPRKHPLQRYDHSGDFHIADSEVVGLAAAR